MSLWLYSGYTNCSSPQLISHLFDEKCSHLVSVMLVVKFTSRMWYRRVSEPHSHLPGWSPVHLYGGRAQGQRSSDHDRVCFGPLERAECTHTRAYAEDTSSFSDNKGALVPVVPMWTRTHLWCSGFSLPLCRASPGPRAWHADGSSSGKHEDECQSDSFFFQCTLLQSIRCDV